MRPERRIDMVTAQWANNLLAVLLKSGKLAHTAAWCSCEMCCNPRHSGFSKGFGKLTMQEHRHLEKMNDGLNEVANDYDFNSKKCA